MKNIDMEATAERIRQLRPGAIASHCEVTPALVSLVLNNKYPRLDTPKAQRVLARLRELGVLVEVDDVVHESRLAA